MKYQAYPAYKDSGVEWLGEVPEHWMVLRIKQGFKVKLGKMLQPTSKTEYDLLLPYMRASNIQPSGIDISEVKEMWINTNEIDELKLKYGDLLVSEGGDVGRCEIWKSELPECYFQNSINRVRALKNNNNVYLKYLLQDIKNSGAIDVICNKLSIAHLTAEKLNVIEIVLPTALEQTSIADFLDRETSRIDELSKEKERFIELLKEKRQALISHAVTKGLNPIVKMKNSGVEWLGEVPEHWNISKLKYAKANAPNSFVDGPFGSNLKTEHFVDNGDVFVIESGFATKGKLCEENLKQIKYEHYMTIKRSSTTCGDIIIAKIGANFGMNNVLPSLNKLAVVSGNSLKLTINIKKHSIKFFHYQLIYLKNCGAIDLLANTTAQPAISLAEMNELCCVSPDLSEQVIICQFIDQQTAKIDALISETQNSINLLKEHRAALISAAVTGKIDVREQQGFSVRPELVEG